MMCVACALTHSNSINRNTTPWDQPRGTDFPDRVISSALEFWAAPDALEGSKCRYL